MNEKKEKANVKIECPHLIICEGIDATLFIVYWLEKVFKDFDRYKQFQPVKADGNSDIPRMIKMLPSLPNFSTVRSLTVVRDSETNPQGAAQSLQASFLNAGFAVPSGPCVVARPAGSERNVKVGYALFPKLNSSDESGTLEDLCLKILDHPDKEKILCIADDAVEACKEQVGQLKRPHKNRLHTYLSLTDKFVGMKIGQSSEAKAFNFLASEMEPLKTLLCAMLEG